MVSSAAAHVPGSPRARGGADGRLPSPRLAVVHPGGCDSRLVGPVRGVGALLDATDLRTADVRVAELLEALPEAYFTLDHDWRLTYLNHRAEDALRRPRADLLGMAWSEAFPDAVGTTFEWAYAHALSTGEPVEFEEVYLPQQCWYAVRAHPIPGGLAVFFRDVCDRHAADMERDRLLLAERQAREAGDVARAALQHSATHDAATGLLNHAGILEVLGGLLGGGPARARATGLVMVGLDDFGVVTGSLGDAAGDRFLAEVAARIGSVFGDGDALGRIQQDQLVVVADGAAENGAFERRAVAVQAAMSRPFVVDGGEVVLRASVGMSAPGPHGPQDWLRRASLALDHARRDRVSRRYVPAMARIAAERLSLENDLRRALAGDELWVAYQPQVVSETGRIVGLEALARWRHPSLGELPPARFIPMAEATGLVVPLDRWVLRAACRHVRAWTDAGRTIPRIAVNLSAASIQRADLVEHVAGVLAETGVDARLLELEITESTMMQRPVEAIQTVRALRRLGVRIAIDDFGTGYSSLSYLQDFEVDTLKVDRSFVARLGDGSGGRHVETAIVTAIIALGGHLGLDLIGEGVETAVQRDVLQQLGCHVVQGHLYHPADRPERIAELLPQ